MTGEDGATVINGDLAAQLRAMKAAAGTGHPAVGRARPRWPRCWPRPGWSTNWSCRVHPAVLADGPRLFDGVPADLALTLAEAQTFASGCVVLHYLVG